jgi:hypothetical protein
MRAYGIPAANAFTCWDVLSESAASSRATVVSPALLSTTTAELLSPES